MIRHNYQVPCIIVGSFLSMILAFICTANQDSTSSEREILSIDFNNVIAARDLKTFPPGIPPTPPLPPNFDTLQLHQDGKLLRSQLTSKEWSIFFKNEELYDSVRSAWLDSMNLIKWKFHILLDGTFTQSDSIVIEKSLENQPYDFTFRTKFITN